MPMRVGFLVGKDNDAVEDPKYVGDASFLSDFPNEFRVDPESKEYLKNCEAGTKGIAHMDCAMPWFLQKHNKDIEIDIILPEDITLERLKSNLCNFVVGYDLVNAYFEGTERLTELTEVFKSCGNLMPPYNVQEFIYYKTMYMKACTDAGIPMAPTLFSLQGKRSASELLTQIKERGWTTFVMKQSFSAFSIGFLKCTVEECEKDPKILEEYFEEHEECPEFIVQEAVPGFCRNWETRCFWWNGEFMYAIANKAAVSTEDGEEVIITGDDIPAEFLENAKRIGAQAIKTLPQCLTPDGRPIGQTLIRTDIGCSDSKLNDKDNTWDPSVKTFFLNEIEYGGTNWFTRHLKFDNMPIWSKAYALKIREINGDADQEVSEPASKKAKITEEVAPVKTNTGGC